LKNVMSFNPKHETSVSRDTVVSFVPMAAVSDETGTIVGGTQRPLAEIWKGYTHFAEGDVLFAKITPCMENGKAAIARGLTNGLGCGSTEFFVFRPSASLLPEYLWHFIRQASFREEAKQAMSGAVGQQRVPASFLREYTFPLPPVAEQRRIVARIEALFERIRQARADLLRIAPLARRYREQVRRRAFEADAGWPGSGEAVPLPAYDPPQGHVPSDVEEAGAALPALSR
jgi:type I restriction enzyme S subunit